MSWCNKLSVLLCASGRGYLFLFCCALIFPQLCSVLLRCL